METKDNLLTYVLMGLVASTTVFLFVLSVTMPTDTEAQEASVMNFSVGNSAPTLGTVVAEVAESLSEATNYQVFCNATVTDLNGYQDVAACNVTFFKTTSGMAGAPDENIRYGNASCALTSGSGNTVDCGCLMGMKYYADGNVAWTCNVTARDASNSVVRGSALVDADGSAILPQLLAIDLTTSIVQWGSLTVSTSTTFNANNRTVVNNTGNVNQSIQVAGAAAQMTCAPSPANVAVGNIEYKTGPSGDHGTGTDLTVSQVTVGGRGWADNRKQSVDKTENMTVYWAISVPTGVNGTCTVTVNQYGAAGLTGT